MSDRVYVCHSLTRGGFAARHSTFSHIVATRESAYDTDVLQFTWEEAFEFRRAERLRNRDWQVYGRPDLVRAKGPGFLERIDPKAQPGLILDVKAPADNQDTDTGAAKFDAGKVRMDLLPYDALYGAAAVFTYGERKYAAWNWAKGMRWGRLFAAMLRHGFLWASGEKFDKESGLPHTWHMLCCCMMLASHEHRRIGTDDRFDITEQHMDELDEIYARMQDPSAGPSDKPVDGVEHGDQVRTSDNSIVTRPLDEGDV